MPTHPTPPAARTIGQNFRKQHSRAALAEWEVAARKRKPLDVLQHAMRGRLSSLSALKLERMSASVFGFFRGAVPIMAYDLSLHANTGILTQLCGDAHVQNLGAYCGPDGRLIFDINDFDETIAGPFEWDVKRMTTSILLAGQTAKMKPAAANAAAEVFLNAYCELNHLLAKLPMLSVARYQVHRLGGVEPISELLRRSERATPLLSLESLTEKSGKGRIFKTNPPLLKRVTGEEAEAVIASLTAYVHTLLPERRHLIAQYRPVDVAFKVVGTGSVGLRDYTVYLEGNGPNDPLFLQIKEEVASAYTPYLAGLAPEAANEGQRTADGQRAMQFQSDPLLGWTTIDGRCYLVRQLNDHKASVDATTMKPLALSQYAGVCGQMLARSHARASDARVIAGYIGSGRRFQEAILQFAHAYAAQSNADWKELLASRKTVAKTGPKTGSKTGSKTVAETGTKTAKKADSGPSAKKVR